MTDTNTDTDRVVYVPASASRESVAAAVTEGFSLKRECSGSSNRRFQPQERV